MLLNSKFTIWNWCCIVFLGAFVFLFWLFLCDCIHTLNVKLATETKKTKPSQAMSTLMFWNKQNGNSNQNGSENGSSGKNGKKTWLHSPESLMNGHVAYLVKVSVHFLLCSLLFHFYHKQMYSLTYLFIEYVLSECG